MPIGLPARDRNPSASQVAVTYIASMNGFRVPAD
jgi:hypothetical protein